MNTAGKSPAKTPVEARLADGTFVPFGEPRPPGRPKGSKNKRTLLGNEFLCTLGPRAKKRLRTIIDGDDDELALKAIELTLAYNFGRPVQAKEISGPDGDPIQTAHARTVIHDDRELARRITLALNRSVPAEIEATVIEPVEPPVLTNGALGAAVSSDTPEGETATGGESEAVDEPAEPEVLFPPRFDQLPSMPQLLRVQRGHENRGHRR